MNTITLKYPEGEFTQAELAAVNGIDKAAVYLPMREAIAKGILNFSGTRPTGGKRPSNLYQVASNNAPVPVPATLPTQPIVETPLAASVPPTPITSRAEAVQQMKANGDILTPLAEKYLPSAPNSAYPCPLCKGPMTEIPDTTGVTVMCLNRNTCPSTEEPYGHGKNSKDAYEIAKQKFHD